MTHVESGFSDWHAVPLHWPRLGAVFFWSVSHTEIEFQKFFTLLILTVDRHKIVS